MNLNLSVSLLLVAVICVTASQSHLEYPAVVTSANQNGACPSAAVREATHQRSKDEARSLLQNQVIPSLRSRSYPPCPCGGPGPWTRIAHLNMSDPTEQCPPNWELTTTPRRACRRPSTTNPTTCSSAIFPTNGRLYSRVCGRVTAYQKGSTDAFDPTVRGIFNGISNPGLEDPYMDGVSITHGPAGSRQHIWSFAAALFETDPNAELLQNLVCSCTTNITWPHQVPSFVGDNYFCATSNPGPFWNGTVIYDGVLWDGEGCGPTNACCEFNNPPWFRTTLLEPTTDDIELRICLDQEFEDEEVLVNFLDINVM